MHLALIEVVDDPRPFREVPEGFLPHEWWIGLDVTVRVERAMAATLRPDGIPDPTAVAPSGTFPVHLYTDIDRSVRTGSFGAPDASVIVRGRRLLVAFPRYLPTRVSWPFELVRTDPAAGRITEGWYQFPPGTPAEQVLDPREWNDPALACSSPPDAGRDAPSGD